MSYEITGRIVCINPTQEVNDKFKKREFVIETTEEINGNNYTNYAKFQCVQGKCDLLDRYAVGEDVTVSFNVKGNRWEKDGKVNYITNLDAWKIASAASNKPGDYSQNAKDAHPAPVTNGAKGMEGAPSEYNPTPENVDDLPF